MTKEKIVSLTKYLNEMKNKLDSSIPEKWAHSPESYKNFLQREVRLTAKKLDDAKLTADSKGAK